MKTVALTFILTLTGAISAAAESGEDQGGSASAADQIVTMSQFEVTTTQGHGYVATNAATAFKTDESLMDIPQGDIVITNDMITDLSYENTSDVLQYFGVEADIVGEYVNLRGSGAFSLPYVDEMPQLAAYESNIVIDSYEVVKGPAQTLYLNATLGGVVLKATKKPLPYNQDILTAGIDTNGLYTFTGDFTGPIGNLGGFKLSYRLVAEYQHGPQYFYNTSDNREVIYPEIGATYHGTTFRAYFLSQSIGTAIGLGILTPSGKLYTGAGWRAADNKAIGDLEKWESSTAYVEALTKISDSLETRLSAAYWKYRVYGPFGYPVDVDWNNYTETFGDLRDDERWSYWTVLDDWQGHFNLSLAGAQIANRDAFGFAFTNQIDKQAYWATAPFPYPNGPSGGTITVPINNASAGITSVVLPPASAATEPPTGTGAGSDFETELSAIYWQHTIDLIPNWLTLIAGFTWDNVNSESIADWSVIPYQATVTTVSQWVHRFGAVVHLTKAVSFYALDSTTFTPPIGVPPLKSLTLPPNQLGKGTELGVKWNFSGGKISGEAAWFKAANTNELNTLAGSFPNGFIYSAVIGTVTEEGVDGDAAFNLMPGWQLVGSWYAGHQVDPYGNPVPLSFDNQWSTFTRYDFAPNGPLKGWTIGGGIVRVGGRWMSTGGLVYSGYLPTVFKVQTGTLVSAFVSYQLDRHWQFRMNCNNVLNQVYPLATQGAIYCDPSEPRLWSFETRYRF